VFRFWQELNAHSQSLSTFAIIIWAVYQFKKAKTNLIRDLNQSKRWLVEKEKRTIEKRVTLQTQTHTVNNPQRSPQHIFFLFQTSLISIFLCSSLILMTKK